MQPGEHGDCTERAVAVFDRCAVEDKDVSSLSIKLIETELHRILMRRDIDRDHIFPYDLPSSVDPITTGFFSLELKGFSST